MMKRIISLSLLFLSICQVWAFDESKYYAIHRNGESASYIYAVGDKMNTGALNAQDGNFIWQFIPTGKSDCYYVKNVLTEMYVQTTAPLNNFVKLGENPVEIMISRGAGTTGTGTTYFFASTDQGPRAARWRSPSDFGMSVSWLTGRMHPAEWMRLPEIIIAPSCRGLFLKKIFSMSR